MASIRDAVIDVLPFSIVFQMNEESYWEQITIIGELTQLKIYLTVNAQNKKKNNEYLGQREAMLVLQFLCQQLARHYKTKSGANESDNPRTTDPVAHFKF